MKNKKLEEEANMFAMLLLMPKEMIKMDLENGIDLTDNKSLTDLAKKYDVPLTAMAVRVALFINKNI